MKTEALILSPELQAHTDWREEGCFDSSQYASGSEMQKRYLAEMEEIIKQDGESL